MKGKLTDSVSIGELRQMYDSGMTYAQIAEALDVSTMTIGRHLRGYAVKDPRSGRGELVASTIDAHELSPKSRDDTSMKDMSISNAANACLVVASKEIALEGTVAKYTAFSKDRCVVIDIDGDMIQIKFDSITDFIDELKAIARNVGGLECGCEMW